MFIRNLTYFFILTFGGRAIALPPPAPSEVLHPGSKIYSYKIKENSFKCSGRLVHTFLPENVQSSKIPAVVYGHGQALGIDHYRQTLEHLAGKGIAAIFPIYDKGFFDTDWFRMGSDYVNMTACAISKIPTIDSTKVIFSGHSKGAYVATMAAGIASRENLTPQASVLMVFAAAGNNIEILKNIRKETSVTVVYSDEDSIVSREISEQIYQTVSSDKKQFINVLSYPDLKATHFWVLTKKSIFGGSPENALHYFGSWKWLTAAALDLKSNERNTQPYLYGELANDKGVSNLTDEIIRNW